jgi:hypothetical protein
MRATALLRDRLLPLSEPKRAAVPLNPEADDIIHHETEFSG